jgi:Ca2+-binding EF-hand superfamily protein
MFYKLFREHFSVEASNELLRRRLARRPNFCLNSAFVYCDREKHGYLTTEDFRQLLEENKIYSTQLELEALVSRYD